MPPGIISLYSRGGEILDRKVYPDKWRRNKVIENWKKLYGVKYLFCFIQIEVIVD